MPRPKSRIQVDCPICRRPFKAYPSEIARGAGRYCTYACSIEAQRRQVSAIDPDRPRQPQIERTCETCLKTFKVYPYRATAARPAKFCSTECRLTRPAHRAIR